MAHRTCSTSFVPALAILALLSALVALPAVAQPAPVGSDLAPAMTPALDVGPAPSTDALGDLFGPDPEAMVTPPKYGPCTMSFQCNAGCGGAFITCSGQNYCEMGYGPRYAWCTQNIYVRCDNKAPIYCIQDLMEP